MKTAFRALALAGLFAAGVATVATVSGPVAFAQAPKQKPAATTAAVATTKKDDPKPSATKGSIVIKPDAKEKFRIYVKDAEGKTLLMTAGAGFATEKEAKEKVEEIIAIVGKAKVTVEKGDAKEPEKDK